VAKAEHHAALPYAQIGAFVAKLRKDSSVGARCLEFITLTAARLGEAINAEWDEIDLANRVWVVPASRMKADREHRVPLSGAALAVLKAVQAIRQSDYVFPGTRQGRPVGENTFRDWASERTSFSREVAEMALAHAIPNAVEAAYRRGDLFEKRRKLMDAWAAYCAKIETDAGKVVALARARTPR